MSRKTKKEDPSKLGPLRPDDLILRKIDGHWYVYTQAGDNLEILVWERPGGHSKTVLYRTLYPEHDFDEEI